MIFKRRIRMKYKIELMKMEELFNEFQALDYSERRGG